MDEGIETVISCSLGALVRMVPKPQYGFLKLSLEIGGQVNDVAVSPFTVGHLIRALRHTDQEFLALGTNDLYVRNADTTDSHCCKTPNRTSLKFSYFFHPNVHGIASHRWRQILLGGGNNAYPGFYRSQKLFLRKI